MIAVSPEFKEAMKQPQKVVRVKSYDLGPLDSDDVSEVSQIWAEELRSVEVNASGMFLSAGSKMVTANVFGDQSPFIGTGVRLDLEVLLPDGTWETAELGYFSVYQVEYNLEDEISKVTLHDPMMTLSVTDYSFEDEAFPMTVHQLADRLAEIGNVELDEDFGSLPNADFEITQNLWATIQNTTFRDVIQQIAEATGTTAVVSGRTMLFKQYILPDSEINEENLIKFRMGKKWGEVNSVSLSRMPQNDNIVLSEDSVEDEEQEVYEAVIINNQIVDNDRQALIQPLYDQLVGEDPYIVFYDSEFTTEAHGWHEVGDLITAKLSDIEYPVFITKHHIYVGPEAFNERITSVAPNNPAVNRTTAGGVLKTLWNTEIKVDKQANEINSTVERQREFEDQTEEDFSLINQTIDQIGLTVQDGGGMNQIKNSVGYSVADGEINFWDVDDLTAVSASSTSAFASGSISGSDVSLSNGPGTFTQRITVNPGGFYVLSFIARKTTQGVATVSISNDSDNWEVVFEDDTSYDWEKHRINEIVPTSNYLDITFTLDEDVELFQFTDLMLVRGIADRGWSQAVGEVANTNVTFDTTGITVKSNVYEGAFTRMTPLEFAGYDDSGQRAFAVNNDTTEVNNLKVDGDIDTPEILIVSLSSGPNAGMNFVVKG